MQFRDSILNFFVADGGGGVVRGEERKEGLFCIYSYPFRGYGPKWHNLTSSGCQISILQVRGPKWHLRTSSRAAGVFNSIKYLHL